MITESLTLDGAFEVVHALPGRVRLRWLGGGEPSLERLRQLDRLPGVERVDYRQASRSVVVYGDGSRLRGTTGSAPNRPRDELRFKSDEPGAHQTPTMIAGLAGGVDLDALLTVGLVATWLADLFTSRAIRLITLPLLVLAGITGYRLYDRRQQRAESDVAGGDELMLLTG